MTKNPLEQLAKDRHAAKTGLLKCVLGFVFDAKALADTDKAVQRLSTALVNRAKEGKSTPLEHRN